MCCHIYDVAPSRSLLLLNGEQRIDAVPIIDRSTPSDIGHCATWRRCPAGHPRRYRYRRPSIVATAKLCHCPRNNDAIPRLTRRTTKNNHHLQIHIRRRRWWRRRRCSPTVDAAGDGGGGVGGGKRIMDSLRWRSRPTIRRRRRRNRGTIAMGRQSRRRLRRL